MRNGYRALILPLLLAPSLLHASEFDEFRIPRHTLYSGTVNILGSASHSRSNSDQQSSSHTNRSGVLSGGSFWSLDSDELQESLFLAFETRGDLHRDRFAGLLNYSFVPSHHNSDDEVRSVNERWSLGADIRRYPFRLPIGLELGASGSGQYLQEWRKSHDEFAARDTFSSIRSSVRSRYVDWRYDYFVRGSGSVGYGRVRDATAVYNAYLLEHRLRDTGALSKELSPDARRKLAALYYIEPGISEVHDRPDKFFWRELERILREDGALRGESLDSYSVFRAVEPYSGLRLRSLRRVGYFVGFTAVADHRQVLDRFSHTYRRTDVFNDTLTVGVDVSGFQRANRSVDEILIGGEAELHRPLGFHWQWDMNGLVLLPTKEHLPAMETRSNAFLEYLIADRWDASAFVAQSRIISRPFRSQPSYRPAAWLVAYGIDLGFYIEDRIRLGVGASERQHAESPGFLGKRTYSRDHSISLGISYHFLGGLNAPGLIAPVRLGVPGSVGY